MRLGFTTAVLLSAGLHGILFVSGCTSPDTESHLGPVTEGTLNASTTSISSTRTGPALEMAGDPEGIVRRGGQYYYLKDRRTTILRTGDQAPGKLRLERNGDVTLSDGRRIPLREGYMVTRGGDLIEIPPYVR
jgi:hypothetical protein